MELKEFENKNVWAVVGSVHNKEKFAYKIYRFLAAKGYRVYAVDPTGLEVDGQKSFLSLGELPEVPEAVDMVINPLKGEAFVEEASSLGIKYIWFQPGAENDRVIELARRYGMNVVCNECVMVQFK